MAISELLDDYLVMKNLNPAVKRIGRSGFILLMGGAVFHFNLLNLEKSWLESTAAFFSIAFAGLGAALLASIWSSTSIHAAKSVKKSEKEPLASP